MKYPDMPTVCDECERKNLTLDHSTTLDEVWLGCDDCSETLWNGHMADFMPFLNQMRTVLPTLMSALQAVITHATETYNTALAPLVEVLTKAEELTVGSRVKVINPTSSLYLRSGVVTQATPLVVVQLVAHDMPFDPMVFRLEELERI
jgi:hypothetical protein